MPELAIRQHNLRTDKVYKEIPISTLNDQTLE